MDYQRQEFLQTQKQLIYFLLYQNLQNVQLHLLKSLFLANCVQMVRVYQQYKQLQVYQLLQ